MKILTPLIFTVVLLTACESSPQSKPHHNSRRPHPRQQADVETAHMDVEMAQMKFDFHRAQMERIIHKAEQEFGQARKAFVDYTRFASKDKLEREELKLKQARERALEAKEELQQLELMYEDQDLDDRTREFVIQRGKRHAENRARELEILQRALDHLRDVEIPQKTENLKRIMHEKEWAIEKTKHTQHLKELELRKQLINAQQKLDSLKKD